MTGVSCYRLAVRQGPVLCERDPEVGALPEGASDNPKTPKTPKPGSMCRAWVFCMSWCAEFEFRRDAQAFYCAMDHTPDTDVGVLALLEVRQLPWA